MKAVFAAALLAVSHTSASAELRAEFIEGAPKDRFVFKNAGACAIKNANLVLDLTGSSAGLVFDVTNKGAGVEVFQPFELVGGEDFIVSRPEVSDGDQSLVLPIKSLPASQSIAFTIDIDDTLGGREITVSDAEIQGAKVVLTTAGISRSGTFDGSAKARVPAANC